MVKIQSIEIKREIDEYADLSFLTDHLGGEEYAEQDDQRVAAYGDWWMLGIMARAEVSYAIGQGNSRLESLTSGGLWGIESDSGAEYIETVAREELADLKAHLGHFSVDLSNFDELAELAISKI